MEAARNIQAVEFPDWGLKDMEEAELAHHLIHNEVWHDSDRYQIEQAYVISRTLHAKDRHRGQLYIHHPLRVANRIVSYLHVYDPDIAVAALLHDTVEDHAKGLLAPTIGGMDFTSSAITPSADPIENQVLAFRRLGFIFSKPVSLLVHNVTNPADIFTQLTYEEKLEAYKTKVYYTTRTFAGFVIKLSDWCDNAVGITHSEADLDPAQYKHFRRKYGNVYNIFETRFNQPDIQSALDDEARAYVREQLGYARERLDVPAA
jgi:(p)ppGpp synthase/HD superfamily hydrolase